MWVLKLFLWITLATCTAWGSAIVLGPALISQALNATFEGSVEVRRLDVSPKLKITASFIKFDILGSKGSIPLEGFVRGVDLSWQIEDGLTLTAKLGPSRIEGVGALEAATIKVIPKGLFDWNSAELVATLSSLKVGHAIADKVHITAGLSDNLGSLKTAAMTAQGIKNERVDIRAEKFILSFSDLDLTSPIEQQVIPFNLDISGSLTGAAGHAHGVNLSGELRSPDVAFDISVEKANFDDFEVAVDKFSASSTYNLVSMQLGPASSVSVARITAERARLNIVDHSGEIRFVENQILTTGNMIIESLELKSGATFLANVSDATLQYEGSIQTNADEEHPLTVDAKIHVTDDLKIVSSLEASLIASDLVRCITKNCAVVSSSISYLVELPSANLTGKSYCEVGLCLPDQMRHSLKTDNTDVFFAELAEERVFSPLMIPLAYYAMRGSSPIGLGHSLDF
jgi:hypothetical protein